MVRKLQEYGRLIDGLAAIGRIFRHFSAFLHPEQEEIGKFYV